ncbi:MAG TPA: ribosome maturation factor RimM [Thermomicrobiales bacterium]
MRRSQASAAADAPADTATPTPRKPVRRPAPKEPTPPPVIPERGPAPERLNLGKIAGTHGLRGEFRMYLFTNHPEMLHTIRTLYLGDTQVPQSVRRIHPLPGDKEAIVRLVGVTSPEEAAELRGQQVWVDREALPPLPEGELYHYQLIGLDVVDEEGTALGRLAEIIETGANDVYVVRGLAGELLLPAINDVILDVNLETGKMTVRQQQYY